MPAYLSTAEFDLFARYYMKAVGCEQQAEQATDQTTNQEWRQLAVQWHSMADQAATELADPSGVDLFR